MSYTKGVYEKLKTFAPESLADDWDPIGPQVYFPEEKLKGVMVCMDVTDRVVQEAIEKNCNVIVSHHPLFFQPLKRFDARNYKSKLLYKSLENKISILSAHTNLDRTKGGVNDALADYLQLKNLEPFDCDDLGRNLGYLGQAEGLNFQELLARIKKLTSKREPVCYGKIPKKISKVAILGGSGAEFMETAIDKGADLFITGDVKYHDGQAAYEHDFCLIDMGHFDSERFVLDKLASLFKEEKTIIYGACDFIIET